MTFSDKQEFCKFVSKPKVQKFYLSARRKGWSEKLFLGKRVNLRYRPSELSGRTTRDCPAWFIGSESELATTKRTTFLSGKAGVDGGVDIDCD